MSDNTLRSIDLVRTERGRYLATNVRGGTVAIGSGEDDDFTPVELLLTALAACSAVDVDFITSKRSEPAEFRIAATGDKIRDDQGNRLTNLALDFGVSFPGDDAGQQAEAVLARSVAQSHDRLCTVSRTVEIGTPVAVAVRGESLETSR